VARAPGFLLAQLRTTHAHQLGTVVAPLVVRGKVVALLVVRGKFVVTMLGGGGGRDLPCHGSGQIFTVLDSFSSSTSSTSALPTQHLILIAVPI